ncbi:MAG: oxidoreductase [Rhodobacter sp.]|nr:oxidoreductase [Rhodobacter sp.]
MQRIWVQMRLLLGIAFAATALMAGAATADTLPQPQGPVILTVSGEISTTNSPNGAEFDLAMLDALGTEEFETTTIWTDGLQQFRGVSLHRLIETLQAEGAVIAASALNDYMVEIPLTDAVEGGPILAFEQNGEALSVRDKGPLWVVYPYDATASYQTEVIYARSIWQVKRMEIR